MWSFPVLLHKGQLSQVGRQFYNTDIEVEILSKEETEKMTYVVRERERERKKFFIQYAPIALQCATKSVSVMSLSLPHLVAGIQDEL